jgi:guanine nucleotide-binding protein G(i) subunit alpha
MMDPITIIGTAGAVANTIDVVSKAIKSMRSLHEQWKGADFTVLNSIAQLTAFEIRFGKNSRMDRFGHSGARQMRICRR